ncbi:hypothetical protein MOF25_06930 [Bacillus atrophaeus]|uniref:hypothetical protein n=1 Tax=Bacillus atrophaeus TaxID=1452 RepID=UPI002281CC70|nr:hypothetical protein [Bacillus atrophaeus]MCY9160067.1 hypothetical protein [Bacillus atrophaeus]
MKEYIKIRSSAHYGIFKGVTIITHGDQSIQIKGMNSYKLLEVLFPMMNGTKTMKEIVSKFGLHHQPVIEYILDQLINKNVVQVLNKVSWENATCTAESYLLDFLSDYYENPNEKFISIKKTRFYLIGKNHLSRSFRESLIPYQVEISEFENIQEFEKLILTEGVQDDGIVVYTFEELDTKLNEYLTVYCKQLNIPLATIGICGNFVVAGPIQYRGSACLSCLIEKNKELKNKMSLFERTEEFDLSPLHMCLVGSYLAFQIILYIASDHGCSDHKCEIIGNAVVLNSNTLTLDIVPVEVHPDCELEHLSSSNIPFEFNYDSALNWLKNPYIGLVEETDNQTMVQLPLRLHMLHYLKPSVIVIGCGESIDAAKEASYFKSIEMTIQNDSNKLHKLDINETGNRNIIIINRDRQTVVKHLRNHLGKELFLTLVFQKEKLHSLDINSLQVGEWSRLMKILSVVFGYSIEIVGYQKWTEHFFTVGTRFIPMSEDATTFPTQIKNQILVGSGTTIEEAMFMSLLYGTSYLQAFCQNSLDTDLDITICLSTEWGSLDTKEDFEQILNDINEMGYKAHLNQFSDLVIGWIDLNKKIDTATTTTMTSVTDYINLS